jgi:UrcA family protein
MPTTNRATALRRLAVFVLAATVATPAFADPIDVVDNTVVVRIPHLAAPTNAAESARVRARIADAAEAACGSDSRSLRDYRYSVRQSQCFRDSYGSAMAQLRARWGENGTAAGML